MADVEKHVETVFTIKGNAEEKLGAIHKAAEHVNVVFEKASHLVGMFGSVAAVAGGAFGAHEVISGTLEYLQNIKKIGDITGMAAEKADGLMDTFKKAGIDGDATIQALQMMSKAGARMEMAMGGVQKATGGVRNYMRELGVDVNKGPEAAFIRLAQLAEKGKVSTERLALAMRVPFDTARKMMTVMKLGPEALRESINELSKKGMAVTAENVDAYSRIYAAQNNIKALWERITLVVGKEFLPVIEDLLQGVSGKLEGWVQHAQSFGKVMSSFLRDHYELVKRTTQALLVNFTIMKATGKGIPENLGKGFGMFKQVAGVGGTIGGAFKGAMSAGNAAKSELYEMSRMTSSLNSGAGAMAASQKMIIQIVGTFLQLKPLLGLVGRLSLVTALVGIVIEGVLAIKDNFMGVSDWLIGLWDEIKSRMSVIVELWSGITTNFGAGGAIGDFFKLLLPMAIGGLAVVVKELARTITMIMLTMQDVAKNPLKMFNPLGEITKNYAKADILNKIQMLKTEQDRRESSRLSDMPLVAPRAPGERSGTNFVFPNARFDITQKFAEGYDPDRIAVAFTNDLASMGERRLQSQFSTIFGVR